MLAIRMQRTGRKGHAMFRMVVQDARRTPSSGKVVAYIGSYDPHSKTVQLDKEKAGFYLEHGAQPSKRAISILEAEKVKLPKWVAGTKSKSRPVRNPEKRHSTSPEPKEQAPDTEASEEIVAKEEAATPVDVVENTTSEATQDTDEEKNKEASAESN